MPRETLKALLEHGRIMGDRLTPSIEPARAVRRSFTEVGISLDAHCARLLDDGVRAFATAFDEMMAVIRERSAALLERR
jgi:transaldolase/glucose-6-phosphate isomerase